MWRHGSPQGAFSEPNVKLREEVYITGGDDLGLDSMVVATSFAVSHRDWTPTLQVSFGNSRALVARFRSAQCCSAILGVEK